MMEVEISKLGANLRFPVVTLSIGTEVFTMNAPNRKLVVLSFDEKSATCEVPSGNSTIKKVFSRDTLRLFVTAENESQ